MNQKKIIKNDDGENLVYITPILTWFNSGYC